MNPYPGLFASTGCIAGVEPVLARVERYTSAGIGRIELGAGVSVAGGDLDTLSEFDGDLLIHNYFPPPPEPFVLNLASRNKDIRGVSLSLAKRAMHWCHRLGIPFYSVHGGFITDPQGKGSGTFMFPHPKSSREYDDAKSYFIASVQDLLESTNGSDVALLVENNVCYPHHVGKLLLQTPSEFEELFAEMDDDRLGILLDTGHLKVSATTLGFEMMMFPTKLAHRIRAIHLHDNDGTADRHLPASPDSWIFGFLPGLPVLQSVIVEAKFESVAALAAYMASIETFLADSQS